MPYRSIDDLPPSLSHLPRHAKEIFVAAFNRAWQAYADRPRADQETIARKIAWSAVKRRYRKADGGWVDMLSSATAAGSKDSGSRGYG